MPDKKTFSTKNAPAAIGPYSQAVRAGNLLFVSGQLPADPASGAFTGESVTEQTRQSITNIGAILAAAGLSLMDVVKTTVFLKDMNTFGEMNGVYAEFFPAEPPARACVEVARLPKDALVEIEAVAVFPG
jgi:2-iminobutanoate/2-iminopropanoate deaminase